MESIEIRAVIKYFYKKGMPPKEIHEDFVETPGKESPSCSTVKNWAAEFMRGGRPLRFKDGLAAPKMPLMMKMSWSSTLWLCVIGSETYEA